MARVPRVARLLEIVTLLQAGTGWTAKALAERFGVSRTRVFNDVRVLRQAGIPVERTGSGYVIAPTFFLPSVRLTPREALALLFPRPLFIGLYGNGEMVRTAREKLLSCLPPPLRTSAEKLLASTHVALPAARLDEETFERVREAVVQRRRIAMTYTGRHGGAPRVRHLDPYGIAFRKHAWYVVGHSVEHGEVRKFRVSRIRSAKLTPLCFTVPKDFSLDAVFEGAWYVFGGRPQRVAVRFSPRVAQLVRDRVPMPDQQIQTLANGGILYRATVRNLDEVAWWLVQYGGEAVVLEPRALRRKVIGLASSTLAAYAATEPSVLPYPLADGAEPMVAEGDAEPPPPPSS